jgi:Raf kinase inhibitor-like YbhB/YbcL family protein
MAFELKSPAFADQQAIPAKYTGDGEDLSPPLEWSDPPRGTKSYILIVEDPDAPAGTFRHWGVYNIMAKRTRLPEGVGVGAKMEDLGIGVNDFDKARYNGPAPPKGHGAHHYHFKLAALDVERLTQPPQAAAARVADIWKAAQGHIIGEAALVGTYGR